MKKSFFRPPTEILSLNSVSLKPKKKRKKAQNFLLLTFSFPLLFPSSSSARKKKTPLKSNASSRVPQGPI
jgi:hypothetical protein